jgi:hypothetical protein
MAMQDEGWVVVEVSALMAHTSMWHLLSMLAGLEPAGSAPHIIGIAGSVPQVNDTTKLPAVNQTTLLLRIPEHVEHKQQLGIQHILAVLVPKQQSSLGDLDRCKELQVLRAFQQAAEDQQQQPGQLWLARDDNRAGTGTTLVMRAWGITMPVRPTACAWLRTGADAIIE